MYILILNPLYKQMYLVFGESNSPVTDFAAFLSLSADSRVVADFFTLGVRHCTKGVYSPDLLLTAEFITTSAISAGLRGLLGSPDPLPERREPNRKLLCGRKTIQTIPFIVKNGVFISIGVCRVKLTLLRPHYSPPVYMYGNV